MDLAIKEKFMKLWKKYFNNAELPLIFYYSDTGEEAKIVKPGSLSRCLVGTLEEVRDGRSLSFNSDSIGCPGGKRYAGFAEKIRPDFEYFLSCGIPNKVEGERYKKSPELVREIVKNWPAFKAPKAFIVFKRWDKLTGEDNPEVVIFFAKPDVLAGLFTLANFDESHPEGVFTPMGSGCSSIITYPYLEKDLPHPRGVIGMSDPSARPYVPMNMLTFSVPMKKLVTMMDNMEESFLITNTWKVLQRRID